MEHTGIALRCRLSPDQLRTQGLKGLFEYLIEPGEPYNPYTTHLFVVDQTDKEVDFDFISGRYKMGFRVADYHMRKENYRLIGYRGLSTLPRNRFRERFIQFLDRYKDQHFIQGYRIATFWFGFEPEIEYGITCTMLVSNFISEVLGVKTYQYLSSHNFNAKDPDPATDAVNCAYLPEITIVYRNYEHVRDNILFPLVVMIIIILTMWFIFHRVFKTEVRN